MEKQTFDSFNDLRKESYVIIKDYRESFIKVILQKNGIIYSDDTHKRDFNALMENHKAEIIKNEKLNHDEVYINGELVAYWNRNYELLFRGGNLVCKILFYTK
jgi:hypothetical protein